MIEFYKKKKTKLQRVDQELKDDNIKKDNLRKKESNEALDLADKHETLTDAKQSDEWKNGSTYFREGVKNIYAGYDVGFSTETDPTIDSRINAVLAKNDIQGAGELLTNNIPNVKETYFNKKKQEILAYEISGKDGLLAIEEYKDAEKRIVNLIKKARDHVKTSTIKIGYDGMADEKFKIKMIEWLADNPVDNTPPKYFNDSKRRQEFEAFITKELEKEEKKLISIINKEHISHSQKEI